MGNRHICLAAAHLHIFPFVCNEIIDGIVIYRDACVGRIVHTQAERRCREFRCRHYNIAEQVSVVHVVAVHGAFTEVFHFIALVVGNAVHTCEAHVLAILDLDVDTVVLAELEAVGTCSKLELFIGILTFLYCHERWVGHIESHVLGSLHGHGHIHVVRQILHGDVA